jgi:hypothetical protein
VVDFTNKAPDMGFTDIPGNTLCPPALSLAPRFSLDVFVKYTASIVLTVVILMAGCATAGKGPLLTPDERQRNVGSFEYAWRKINDEYRDSKFGDIDWQPVHDELRPRIA